MNRFIYIFLFCISLSFVSCEKHSPSFDNRTKIRVSLSDLKRDKVMLLYSAGFNNLSPYLIEDMTELEEGLVYPKYSSKGAILIFGRHTKLNGKYDIESRPCLIHMYKDEKKGIVKEVLLLFNSSTKAADKETMTVVLNYIKENFPSENYGMIFSSHATGWLPAGYYTNPTDKGSVWGGRKKSIGADYEIVNGKRISHEMEIWEMVSAFPMKFNYILFDTCLMGGIEVAYEFREVCDKIGFSQTEVLADGYNYKTIAENLISPGESSPEQVCMDYYNQYINQTGVYQSATISLIKTSELEPLAQVCKELFEKYRTQILALDKNIVQRYYRYNYHWFYDLQSIIIEAGATPEELSSLQKALNQCVIYKAATPNFMLNAGGFPIRIHSGLSMYLPNASWTNLNEHYMELEWNKATNLVN